MDETTAATILLMAGSYEPPAVLAVLRGVDGDAVRVLARAALGCGDA